ncbi:hypothetical protein JG688_00005577 [Phytophthora aleatoria]|uniref:Uncharacterized protein n=1 Tax=Phytophthora aleatoria TaxID=2496075 RepID=A0A8J5J1X4_9STRA|nr:hypothetical protein JG688_00005577 [Phytophthora aleatoria]
MHQLQAAPKRQRCLFPRRNSNADEVKIETKSMWEELAEVHYHARLQAEEKNHTLKTILASQVQMSEKVCAIVQEQAVFQARYFLLRLHFPRRPDHTSIFFFVFLQEMDLACIEPPVPHSVFSTRDCELNDTILHSDSRWIRC